MKESLLLERGKLGLSSRREERVGMEMDREEGRKGRGDKSSCLCREDSLVVDKRGKEGKRKEKRRKSLYVTILRLVLCLLIYERVRIGSRD